VVDEAQNLTPRAGRAAHAVQPLNNERSLIQTFLLGQPEFRSILQSPDMQQLRQRVVASYHLGPLDADETRGYIEHRLRTVGWQGTPSFEQACCANRFQRYPAAYQHHLTACCRSASRKSHFGETEVGEGSVEEPGRAPDFGVPW
jgi:type II secretory pathway predicted ATPase ExeA